MSRRHAAAAVALLLLSACASETSSLQQRQEDVARSGAQVMPFDLERTTHRFEKTAWGGVQTVTADDFRDEAQVALVRAHLADEARAFRAGDFSDPVTIHGDDMPGVAILTAKSDRMTVDLEDVEGGALLEFRTQDPEVRAAMHAWFDAQLSDHGSHAEGAH